MDYLVVQNFVREWHAPGRNDVACHNRPCSCCVMTRGSLDNAAWMRIVCNVWLIERTMAEILWCGSFTQLDELQTFQANCFHRSDVRLDIISSSGVYTVYVECCCCGNGSGQPCATADPCSCSGYCCLWQVPLLVCPGPVQNAR